MEEKADEIGAKFEHSARKPSRNLAQESASSSNFGALMQIILWKCQDCMGSCREHF
jgi:hypothetical protein